MKATVSNKSKRPARVMVRTAGSALEVTVRDARDRGRRVRAQGIFLDPGETFEGNLPAVTKRGKAVLGLHGDEDMPADLPTMRDGELTIAQALIAAQEFDSAEFSEGVTHPARQFVQWLAAEVIGTPAHDAAVSAKAALTASALPTQTSEIA